MWHDRDLELEEFGARFGLSASPRHPILTSPIKKTFNGEFYQLLLRAMPSSENSLLSSE